MSPIYLYRCEKRHETEYLTRFGTRPPERCPKCGRKVEQVMAAPRLRQDGTYSYLFDK